MNDFARPQNIGDGGRVTYGTDDGLMVEFEIKPKLMEFESKEQGHPVYEDRVYTRIVAPGNTKTTWYHETKGITYVYNRETGEMEGYEFDPDAPEAEPIRFPKAWARFQKKGEKVKEGWAIEEWGAITRSLAETLKALNIHTVEALASLSDANCESFLGGRKFRDLAKAAMSDAETLSLASKEQERANGLAEDKKQLEKVIKDLQAQINALSDKKGKAA